MQILIVDDEQALLEVLESDLNYLGHQVIKKNSGKSTYNEFIKNENIDLVISDQSMAEGTGEWLFEQIRINDQEIPLILISAFTDIGDVKLKKLNVFDRLAKPYRFEKLKELLEKF